VEHKLTWQHCEHVFKDVKYNPCEECGKETHAMDWELQNKLHRKWKEENPDAAYGGWWSI